MKGGIYADPIWKNVRVQSILGEDDFTKSLADYVTGRESIAEIPKSQRFINRPTLGSLFNEDKLRNRDDRDDRDERICEAVEKHGYKQKEVADHLGLHFASISRILKTRAAMLKK